MLKPSSLLNYAKLSTVWRFFLKNENFEHEQIQQGLIFKEAIKRTPTPRPILLDLYF